MTRWEWEDETAPKNGIGPVCKYCNRLIDGMWDHSATCPAFVAKTELTERKPFAYPVKTHVMVYKVDVPVLNTWERLGTTDTVMWNIKNAFEETLNWYHADLNLVKEWDEEYDDES